MKVLVLNAGSSSHKLSLYDLKDEEPVKPLWKGTLDWGRSEGIYFSTQANQIKEEKKLENSSLEQGLDILLKSIWEGPNKVIESPSSIEAIGHRVVHGGSLFEQPTLIRKEVKEQIRKMIPLAPLHNPVDLQGIEIMEKLFPLLPQIAVFDTAFHLTMPDKVKTYALPYAWKEEGIQRFGFHGISHQYCSERAAKLMNRDLEKLKIINCHLGNGCSLCAIKEGKSVNTTMGFTPMEGLMMGTRSGTVDPGILLYLLRENKQSVKDLDRIMNFESGLKGICGSSDMREIIQRKEGDLKVKLGFDMFIFHLRSYLGALITDLGGADAICFTAGIGEHAYQVREAACHGLEFMGIHLDFELNKKCKPDQNITGKDSKTKILVIQTEEEWMIAKACLKFSLRK